MKQKLLTLALLICTCLQTWAYEWTDIYGVTWTYTLSGSDATITNSSRTSGNLIIPNKVNGYTVTDIGNSAFEDCSGLTNVTIPSSVTSIGRSTFSGCSSLTTVYCNIEEPLGITEETFSNSTNSTLYVPAGCKEAYETALYWQDFNIVEMGESISSNYIVAHFNTTGGNAAIGWSLSHDGILQASSESYEATIQHISKIVIDDNEYSYLGASLSDYGYDTSV